jgi:hypothetical protein
MMQNKLLIKLIQILFVCVSSSNLAQARSGVGHGGGGEWFVIKCVSYAEENVRINLKFCMSGETNSIGKYEIIPCGKKYEPFVILQRTTKMGTEWKLSEQTKIPSFLFNIEWSEKGYLLEMKNREVGQLKLFKRGNIDKDYGTSLLINLSSMKYNLKSVTCEFGSN